MAAALFVLCTVLSTAVPTETQETRVSRAEAAQLEAASHVWRQLGSAAAVKLDGGGNDGFDDPPAFAPSVFTFDERVPGRTSATANPPTPRPNRPARDGDSRAPPSA